MTDKEKTYIFPSHNVSWDGATVKIVKAISDGWIVCEIVKDEGFGKRIGSHIFCKPDELVEIK